jgi:hypothetical protein
MNDGDANPGGWFWLVFPSRIGGLAKGKSFTV